MPSKAEQKAAPGDWGAGLFFLLLGLSAVWQAGAIPSSAFRSQHDPGPAALPVALGTVLIAGGLSQIVLHLIQRMRSQPGASPPALEHSPARIPAVRLGPVLWLSGSLLLYAAAVPWTGFALATWIFGVLFLFYFRQSWHLSLLAPALFVTLIYLLFTRLFKVQLPAGEIGLPF